MPFDGSGNFSRLYSWQSDRDNGIRILASKMDGEFDNFAAGMNQVFFRNGLVPMSGSLNMGQNYINGLGAGSNGALSLRWADDPNSGWFLNGYGRPTLVAGGVNRLDANTAGVSVAGTFTGASSISTAGALNAATGVFSGAVTGASFAATGQITGNSLVAAGLQLNGGRSMSFDTTAGRARIRGDAGGWETSYGFQGNNGADLGGFGMYGTAATSTYYYVGPAFNAANTLRVYPDRVTYNDNTMYHTGNFNPGNYAALSGAQFTGAVGFAGISNFNLTKDAFNNPIINLDTGGDFYGYNRDQNYHDFWVNNASVFRIGAGTATVIGSLNATGAITQNGQQVYHTGNFNPGNYATLANPTFTGNGITVGTKAVGAVSVPTAIFMDNSYSIATGSPAALKVQLFRSGTSAYGFGLNSQGQIEYHSGDTGTPAGGSGHAFYANGELKATILGSGSNFVNGALQQNGNPVWHSGNFTPGNYAALSGAAFTGRISRDPTFYLDFAVNGAEASINFDTNDGLNYNRTADQYKFYVNGTPRATIDGSGNLNATGAITQAGNQVWHAANFNPNAYALLVSPAFTGTPTAPTAAAGASTGQLATTAFVTGADNLKANLSGANFTGALTQNGNQVYHAGNFNPGNYAALSGATFSGNIAQTGAASVSAGTGGFATASYLSNARNPIWRFGNADAFGFSYFQGSAGNAGQDTIGFHFGTASAAGSILQLNQSGTASFTGVVTAPGFVKNDGGSYAFQGTPGLGARMTRGTAVPSGGVDGDMYFQYS